MNTHSNYELSGEYDELNSKENFRKLLKIKQVYDSISEEEQNFIIKNKFFIKPNSISKLLIDFFTFLVCFYSLFITPIRIIFFDSFSYKIFLLELFFDFIYIFDFLFSFFTAFYDFEENYISKYYLIFIHYIRGFFFIDLITVIPFNSIIEFNSLINFKEFNMKYNFEKDIFSLKNSQNFIFSIKDTFFTQYDKDIGSKLYSESYEIITRNSFSLFLKNESIFNYLFILNKGQIWRLVKLIRILKAFKVFYHNEFLLKIKEFSFLNKKEFFTGSIFRIFSFYFIFLIISHILSCIYIFLGTLSIPNWIQSVNLQDSSFSFLYLSSLYFNHTTIFSIGYGDILSRNLYEKIYNIILMIVGVMLYSFALTAISSLIQNDRMKYKNYEKKKNYLDHITFKYSITDVFYKKINRYLYYEMITDKKNKNFLLNDLPNSLRNEMIINMHLDIIRSFNFFKDCFNNDFIIQSIMILKPIKSIKNDILILQGDFVEEIIFIKTGIMQLETLLNIGKMEFIMDNKTVIEQNFLRESNVKQTYYASLSGIQRLKTFKNSNPKSKKKLKEPIYEKFKIILLRKNEHFGDALMIDNKRSPLTVRTKSKVAEIFLMNKTDVMNLAGEFSEIFEKIYTKSSFNMFQIAKNINRAKKIYENKNKALFENKNKLTIIENFKRGKNQNNKKINNLLYSPSLKLDIRDSPDSHKSHKKENSSIKMKENFKNKSKNQIYCNSKKNLINKESSNEIINEQYESGNSFITHENEHDNKFEYNFEYKNIKKSANNNSNISSNSSYFKRDNSNENFDVLDTIKKDVQKIDNNTNNLDFKIEKILSENTHYLNEINTLNSIEEIIKIPNEFLEGERKLRVKNSNNNVINPFTSASHFKNEFNDNLNLKNNLNSKLDNKTLKICGINNRNSTIIKFKYFEEDSVLNEQLENNLAYIFDRNQDNFEEIFNSLRKSQKFILDKYLTKNNKNFSNFNRTDEISEKLKKNF